jgi:hypothetical protein
MIPKKIMSPNVTLFGALDPSYGQQRLELTGMAASDMFIHRHLLKFSGRR